MARATTCSPISSRHSAPASSTPPKFSAWTTATIPARRSPGSGRLGAPTTGALPAATTRNSPNLATPLLTGSWRPESSFGLLDWQLGPSRPLVPGAYVVAHFRQSGIFERVVGVGGTRAAVAVRHDFRV